MQNEPKGPQTEEESRVRALNLQGLFLERWVEDTVRRTDHWGVVAPNVPVDFDGPYGRQDGEIDVLAERGGKQLRVTVPIECKKHNPNFIEWVFFEKLYREVLVAKRHDRVEHASGVSTIRSGSVRLNLDGPMTFEARELRGKYADYKAHDNTKTANDAIRSAAQQVALAHQALVQADVRTASVGEVPRDRMESRIFLPMIVTTAHLTTAKVDPALIDAETGEIPLDGLRFEKRTSVVYEYPLPPKLQTDKTLVLPTGELSDAGHRLHVLVVHSGELPKVLAQITEDIQAHTFLLER